MREVIDLLSSDSSDLMMLFDDDPLSLETSSMKGSYSAVRQDSLSTTGSVEAYTYDFERLLTIKGKLQNISFSFYTYSCPMSIFFIKTCMLVLG